MRTPWVFGLAFSIPLSLGVGLVRLGFWVFLPLVLVFVLIPLLDARMGMRTDAPDESRGSHRAYDAWLVLWVPAQVAIMAWTFSVATSGAASWWEVAGLVVSLGVLTGAGGITVAHELMHRKTRWERGLAEALMTLVSYPHFCVEHVYGHHRNVATPSDPATARFGQSLYAFFLQTIGGSLRSFWRLEQDRARRGRARGLGDARWRYSVLILAVYGAIGSVWGWGGVGLMVVQSLVAILMLETINYVEHYGLLRARRPDGRYERVVPRHSWNSEHLLTGVFLFNLPRHADHHFLASRPYAVLRKSEDGPQLPAGYATMLLLALVPPLWRKVMDPRVRAIQGSTRVDFRQKPDSVPSP